MAGMTPRQVKVMACPGDPYDRPKRGDEIPSIGIKNRETEKMPGIFT